MKTKICTNCGYEKSAKDFYNFKNRKKIAKEYEERLEKLTASK